MKLAIIINTNNAETAWNALRLGNMSLKAGHSVSVFLMGSGWKLRISKTPNTMWPGL